MSDIGQNDLDDIRGDVGVLLAKIRDEWRDELQLRFSSFENRLRLYILAAVVVLRFDVPKSITVPALALAGAGAVSKAIVGRFFSQ